MKRTDTFTVEASGWDVMPESKQVKGYAASKKTALAMIEKGHFSSVLIATVDRTYVAGWQSGDSPKVWGYGYFD